MALDKAAESISSGHFSTPRPTATVPGKPIKKVEPYVERSSTGTLSSKEGYF